MQEIRSCDIHKLDDKIYDRLYHLNHGDRGSMQYVLNCIRHNIKRPDRMFINGSAHYMLIDGIIVGWCLTFYLLYKEKWQHIAYLYVGEPYREKGYGTHIANYVKNKFPSILAHKEYTSCFDQFDQADGEYLN